MRIIRSRNSSKDVVTLDIVGQCVDSRDARVLQAAFAAELECGSSHVIVRMNDYAVVTSEAISDEGLGMLIAFTRKVVGANGLVVLTGVPNKLRQKIESIAVRFDIYEDEAAALAAMMTLDRPTALIDDLDI